MHTEPMCQTKVIHIEIIQNVLLFECSALLCKEKKDYATKWVARQARKMGTEF